MHTGVYCGFDFDRDGFSDGVIGLPFSVDRSPYYRVQTPVYRWKSGNGKRILLLGGNHGDEYDGPIALFHLMRALGSDPAINGAITIIPRTNAPACRAAKRCSPLDGGNLNRAFPGDAAGTPTYRLAHFLEAELFPRHDVVFDLHSGGTTMEHLPCSLMETCPDPTLHDQTLRAMKALGMPYGFVANNGPDSPTSMAAARRTGIIGVSGEFGGCATVTPTSIRATGQAIDNLLIHFDIAERGVIGVDAEPTETTLLDLSRPETQSIFCQQFGWFEPAQELGSLVRSGDLAGWLHDPERPFGAPQALRFQEDGLVITRRLPTHCEPGDCLMNIAAIV